jgi:uncharacterized membrane protein (UPF0127 family)
LSRELKDYIISSSTLKGKAMKKNFILAMLVLGLFVGCTKQSPTIDPVTRDMQTPYTKNLQVGDKKLLVQIVTSGIDMQQGLSDRSKLEDNQGMLFDYGAGTEQMPTFWMKSMRFNLDLIWIKDKKIIGVTKNVPAPLPSASLSTLPTYSPPSPVDQVLEVNAGWVERNNIKIGDEISLR